MWIGAILVVVCLGGAGGCQQQSQTPTAAASRPPQAKPSPEDSFRLIVETFRRGVEDVPIGFVLRGADGHSMMTGKNEVSDELIPPAKEGEPYKAVITVGSQSRYSIQHSTTESEGAEEAQAADDGTDSFADLGEGGGVEVFDPDLISTPGAARDGRNSPSPETTEKTVTRQADRQDRRYELIYEDGKWSLVTKLDPETEQSIQNAFRRALATQI
jgi:hypothetical protein